MRLVADIGSNGNNRDGRAVRKSAGGRAFQYPPRITPMASMTPANIADPVTARMLNRSATLLLLQVTGQCQAVQMFATAIFWNRCGLATAEDG